jgi:hypothetical protein
MDNEKAVIQITLLKAELLLCEAEKKGFQEAIIALKKQILFLYKKLKDLELEDNLSGIKENLSVSENISITLFKNNGDTLTRTI